MYRIFFLFLILQGVVSYAQKSSVHLAGQVRDALSGAPVESVNVLIQGTVRGTATDKDGKFEIDVADLPVTLIFSMIGYETVNHPASNADFIQVSLVEEIILGQAVVVSASRVEENILQSPVSIEKFGLNEIKQLPVATFYDGL